MKEHLLAALLVPCLLLCVGCVSAPQTPSMRQPISMAEAIAQIPAEVRLPTCPHGPALNLDGPANRVVILGEHSKNAVGGEEKDGKRGFISTDSALLLFVDKDAPHKVLRDLVEPFTDLGLNDFALLAKQEDGTLVSLPILFDGWDLMEENSYDDGAVVSLHFPDGYTTLDIYNPENNPGEGFSFNKRMSTYEQLQSRLARFAREHPGEALFICCTPDSPYHLLIRVLDLCQAYGIPQAHILSF